MKILIFLWVTFLLPGQVHPVSPPSFLLSPTILQNYNVHLVTFYTQKIEPCNFFLNLSNPILIQTSGGLKRSPQFTHPSSHFISILLSDHTTSKKEAHNRIYMIANGIKSTYIFVSLDLFVGIQTPLFRKIIVQLPATSQLVIFSTSHTHNLFHIPIITMDHVPRVTIVVKEGTTLSDFETVWRQNNDNLQGSILTDRGSNFGQKWPQTWMDCGRNLHKFNRLGGNVKFCMFNILSKKYNVTILLEGVIPESRTGSRMGYIIFNTFLSLDLIRSLNNFKIYEVAFDNFVFSITTHYSKVAGNSNIGAIFSPLDYSTWVSLLSCCMLVACLNSYVIKKNSRMISMITQFLDMISLLLGQSGSGLDRIFHQHGRFSVLVLLTFYFFGGCILMENLYKGEIYAVLTVQILPALPKSFEALIDSNFLIISTTKFQISEEQPKIPIGTHPCILKYKIIPSIIHRLGQKDDTKFVNLLRKFDVKLKCGSTRDSEIFDAVSKSEPLLVRNSSLAVHKTFAFLDTVTAVASYTNLAKMMGGRLIIDKFIETPFHMNLLIYGGKNFISKKISKLFRSLTESGVWQGWENLGRLHRQIYSMKTLKPEFNGKFWQKMMSDGEKKDLDMFKDVEPVLMKVMKHVFTLSAVCVLISGSVLIVEFILSGWNESGKEFKSWCATMLISVIIICRFHASK